MTTLLNVQRVKYQCSCGSFKSLCFLYFCRHCLKIKCKDCVTLEVDCRFCPSCYEHLQSHEAITRKNRCQNCFSCPSCYHTLVTRATNSLVALPSNLNITPENMNVGVDADDSLSNSTNTSGLQTPSKKVYYLACSVCRWSTRDIHLADQPTINSWKAQDNIHEGRFNELLQHYKQIATREKQERDRKRYSTVKLRNTIATSTTRSSSDKYGVLTPLTRRGIRTGGILKTPSLNENLIPANSSPKPSDPIEIIEPLDENLFLSDSFDFNKLTTITQRLNSVESQPLTIDHLYPLAKNFTSKQSKRCKECDHNVLKPEPSPKLIKFKLHQMALFFIPEVRIWHHPAWSFDDNNPCIISVINQVDEKTLIKLYTLDEIRQENDENNSELIERIGQLDENTLTSILTFPIEKERSVQLHPHVEPNDVDTKINDELRQNDPKDLVIHRKFAKLAIRCFVKIKNSDVKRVQAAFVIEHRVVGISSIVSTPTTANSNPNAKNIRHIILIDFGSIDEPALPLHSALV
ncbi:unnamed protein product [Rotaria magnacalcarata]|uniref:Dynactin subunit 4 n=2 Tax=Rotaria magnacalcarata TaxID=392030 RepID=A0A819PRA9_9BILA|nr:unnamed protein product [Rotaria magnacalcarata]CAF2023134.1 unnamed protein product [Rotaria magnacalcarata]CAF2047242.1 unnamed protein product [Rotaria magnacalcarata]CAF3908635.1 unnamed protein product [Rotaria magnacalcarata]CAF4021847.1 unnamed protein product [Rotaria magnacalcarata]